MSTALNFPVWSCISAEGQYEVGQDDDGSPMLPVWATPELASEQAPAGMIVVPLGPDQLGEVLRAMPGDSTLAIYREGQRFRLPAKKALEALRTQLGER